jgi:acyl-CoA reductase-like NAD-dependent aldehyde dehydrogenase
MNHTMTINGEPVDGEDEFDVLNPATEEVVGRAPDCSRAQLDAAMQASERAFPLWSADPPARSAALKLAAERVRSVAQNLGPLFTAEQGRPLRMAIQEIAYSATWLDYFADLELPGEVAYDGSLFRSEVSYRPMGTVAAITPWNAPVLLAMWKIAAALAAGNTMVLKPSPFTPLTTLAVGATIAEVLPPGVLNVISGLDPLGQLMVEHAVPRKVSLTGSVATGKRVAIAAARDLKRVTLELGGNDAAIILDDANLDTVVPAVFGSAFANSGQICEAVKRVYVPESMYAAVVERFATLASQMRCGNGMDPDVTLGPLTTAAQRDRVEELVQDAEHHGARITAGGKRVSGPGYFYEPTIVCDVSDGIRLVDEEQFGPALPLIAYRTVDEAIERSNASPYGLTASVWSSDEQRAVAVAQRLQVGRVKVNSHGGIPVPQVPFGGVKWSGIGVENGTWGLRAYSDVHVTEVYRPATP